jgi:hypothetical protein
MFFGIIAITQLILYELASAIWFSNKYCIIVPYRSPLLSEMPSEVLQEGNVRVLLYRGYLQRQLRKLSKLILRRHVIIINLL